MTKAVGRPDTGKGFFARAKDAARRADQGEKFPKKGILFQTIDDNGDVILGKKFAGRQVTLDQTGPGMWAVKLYKSVAGRPKSSPSVRVRAK